MTLNLPGVVNHSQIYNGYGRVPNHQSIWVADNIALHTQLLSNDYQYKSTVTGRFDGYINQNLSKFLENFTNPSQSL